MFVRGTVRSLEDYFLPLSRRPQKAVYFTRLNGYDETVDAFLLAFCRAVRTDGVIGTLPLPKLMQGNLDYYYDVVGRDFQLSLGFLEQSLKRWLPSMQLPARRELAVQIYEALSEQARTGSGKAALEQTFIRYMNWIYCRFRQLCPALGGERLPKILLTGTLTEEELRFLRILSASGSDIVLAQPQGDAAYLALDPTSARSDAYPGGKKAFPVEFSVKWLQQRAVLAEQTAVGQGGNTTDRRNGTAQARPGQKAEPWNYGTAGTGTPGNRRTGTSAGHTGQQAEPWSYGTTGTGMPGDRRTGTPAGHTGQLAEPWSYGTTGTGTPGSSGTGALAGRAGRQAGQWSYGDSGQGTEHPSGTGNASRTSWAAVEDYQEAEAAPADVGGLFANTSAFEAERELDGMLYEDSGMFRSHQYGKANAVLLKMTYEELFLYWDKALNLRPSFAAEEGAVTIPVLFAKVSGVPQGGTDAYFRQAGRLWTEDTILIRNIPFAQARIENPFRRLASGLIHDGRLLRGRIRALPDYQQRFGMLRGEMQEHILDKVQLILDKRLIKGIGTNGAEYVVISTALYLDRQVLRLIQSFDFTKKNPKLLIIHTSDKAFTMEDAITFLLLALIGFDVALFVPTGYQGVERYYALIPFQDFQVGEYMYDLPSPSDQMLKPPVPEKEKGTMEKIFGMFSGKK